MANDPNDSALQGIINALAQQQQQQGALSRMMMGYGTLGNPNIPGVSEPAYMGLSSNAPMQSQPVDPIGSRFGNAGYRNRRR
jgi:hypothetical protein